MTKKTRLGFFADLHIQNEKEGVQTDLLGPSYKISKNAKKALNDIKPDYIFGLGDYTSYGKEKGWIGYKKWLEGIRAPVLDVFGNHDRENIKGIGNYGTGYFTKLGRVSGTKVLKLGNNIFILISEEHNPEFNGNGLASTIPEKRFQFVEKYLKKYSGSHNIFIMNHVPIIGTVAFSTKWFLGRNKNWGKVSEKLLGLLEKYEVDAHVSGHIHSDYRWKDKHDEDGKKLGKFVYGPEIGLDMPETYFLNMPVVDHAHGWFRARFKVLSRSTNYLGNKSNQAVLKLYTKLENIGPSLFDLLLTPKTSEFLGRSAIYYFDMEEGEDKLKVTTRWLEGNKDVETYEIELNNSLDLGDGKMHFIASDLSLRDKKNLIITRDEWFKVKAGNKGIGKFSKRYKEKKTLRGLKIKGKNPRDYSVKWKGSENKGETWSSWETDPQDLGEVNAVLIKVKFEPGEEDSYIRHTKIKD